MEPSNSQKWLPLAVVSLLLSSSLVALAIRCLLTDEACTRWGPESGANFSYPLSTSALHLAIVSMTIATILVLKDIIIKRRKPRLLDRHLLYPKLRLSSLVGCSFGMNAIIAHVALQQTPAAIFEIFHGLHLVFIAVAAWIVLGEAPEALGEFIALVGIVIGSSIASLGSFFAVDDEGREGGEGETNGNASGHHFGGLLAFALNMIYAILGGIVVATLRWTTLRMDDVGMSISELTCLKMLVGALFVVPVALLFEGFVMFQLSSEQLSLVLISSALILVYHLSLSLVCYMAPALVVGVVEAIKPVLAFVVVAMFQRLPSTTISFYVGAFIILASAVSFKLIRTLYGEGRQFHRSDSGQHLLAGTNSPATRSQREILGHRLVESVPLNERIGNDLESDSDGYG